MLFFHLLGLASLLGTAAADLEPSSFVILNPPDEQKSFLLVTNQQTLYVGPTDYFSTVPEPTTVVGVPITVSKGVDISVATVTKAAGTDAVGDVSIFITPKLRNKWTDLAKAAGCKAATKRTLSARIAAPACSKSFVRTVIDDLKAQGLLDVFSKELPMITSADLAVVLQGLASPEVAAGAVAIIFLFGLVASAKAIMPDNIKIPAKDVSPVSTSASSSSSSCAPRASGKSDGRICQDQTNCKGDDKNICQAGKYKGCDCLKAAEVTGDLFNFDINRIQSVVMTLESAGHAPTKTVPHTTSASPTVSFGVVACSNPPPPPGAPTPDPTPLDPGYAYQAANVFCDRVDFKQKGLNDTIGGWDVNWQQKLPVDGGFNMQFLKRTDNVCTPQQCKDAYSSLITACQYNHREFYGWGGGIAPCGGQFYLGVQFGVTADVCGEPGTGDKKCVAFCKSDSGKCLNNQMVSPPNHCECD